MVCSVQMQVVKKKAYQIQLAGWYAGGRAGAWRY